MEKKLPESAAETEQTPSSEEQVEQVNATVQRAREYAAEQAQTADRLIREHPYETLGIALGLGVLVGLLAGRK